MVPSSLEGIARVAGIYYKSGLLPSGIKSPEAAFVWASAAVELRITFTAAVTGIAVINGRPSLHSRLPLALAQRTGELAEMRTEWSDGGTGPVTDKTACSVTVTRRYKAGGELTHTGTFSIADAKQAGLLGKDVWKSYPRDMLFARAKTRALNETFGDSTLGMSVIQPGDEGDAFEPRRMVVKNEAPTTPSAAAAAFAAMDQPDQPRPREGAGPADASDTPPAPAPSALFVDEIVEALPSPLD